ncbi:hypothetical protein MKZ02_22605 [Pseudobacillus sp. FSL P4-0506]|uniref:hypothetical protein n=1 Tax=Pseudobacillus sp. FSL P4-0506 TaxID=2921576 RepID=UPI0030FCD68C
MFSFTANNNDIEKTKLIDAFHDSFRRAGLTAYYINVGEMGNKEAQKLSQTYIHPKSENMWNPFFSLSLVENGGVNTLMTKEMTSKEAKDLFKKEAKDNVNHLEEISSIDRDVKKILEYIQVSQISLTDQKGSTN